MCFSAQASFAASAGLFFIGWLVNRNVRRPEQRMLASMPLFFAIQQAAEGVVWLTVDRPDIWVYHAAVDVFLFFAYILWPAYIARALLSLESVAWRAHVLHGLSWLGNVISAVLLFHVAYYGVAAQAISCHIVYQFQQVSFFDTILGSWREVGTMLYAVAVLVPFFVSSLPYLWVMGLLIFAAMAISYVWYYMAFVSVWCFFAALISALLYVLLK